MKCDETKPACLQCSRRKVECGGYSKDLRWKLYDKPKPARKNGRTRSNFGATSNYTETRLELSETQSSDELGTILRDRAVDDDVASPFQFPIDFTNDFSDGFSLDADIGQFMDPLLLTSFLPSPIPFDDGTELSSLELLHPHDDHQAQLHASINANNISSATPASYDDPGTVKLAERENEIDQILHTTEAAIASHSEVQDLYSVFRRPYFESCSLDMISTVFNNHTSNILSIEGDPHSNHWRISIWPMAEGNPALYDALAAMVCFHVAKAQPQVRSLGIKHFESSVRGLQRRDIENKSDIAQAIATNLALAFAQTWDYVSSSTGKQHILEAKVLLGEARALSDDEAKSHNLIFLARTLLYMDVIARFTSTPIADNSPIDLGYTFIDSHSLNASMDPLMGYATSLFPTIGRVANLISLVWRRSAKRNSPTIISKAIDLWRSIERWSTPVELSMTGDSTSIKSDVVQTAEAYRWATLLLLHQAVPELPLLTSWSELAQKILIYLATTPLTSRAIIVQIFPLMLAGCEVVEEEDKEWVRERWTEMSKRMVTGIVDRCLAITEEVWRRRDEYAANHGLCPISGLKQSSCTDDHPHSTVHPSLEPSANMAAQNMIASRASSHSPGHCIHDKRPSSASNDFPISAAFKKGVDTITRSGYTDYSVKGKLHWLGVMNDWNWEVMLG
ncbi:fungal-specific transcription factor domain-containing protein [Lophiotrema nucula]|uniref:Fungal-specific transcription factor domain-containing protein n=1 Tax=Lophiotrema nucula TaxID=690887 RepID=A0A6A5YNY9_9PLEO|nr:fungal-specific transcription factor domain-containing protein [Lophiotrema nucula]